MPLFVVTLPLEKVNLSVFVTPEPDKVSVPPETLISSALVVELVELKLIVPLVTTKSFSIVQLLDAALFDLLNYHSYSL